MIQLKKLLFLFNLLFLCSTIFAQNIPSKPSPAKFVNDNALILSPAQRDTLEKKLKTFSDKTSNQVVILTVNSLYGYSIESYSIKVAETWGIGQKGQDNGILILVAKNDRKMRIEVGYGLEASIPDAYAKKLINTILKPNFKQSKFYTGLHLASNELIKKISPNYADTSLEGIEETTSTYQSNLLTSVDVLPRPSKLLGLIDSAKVFTKKEIEKFNRELGDFEKETSMKILIVTLPEDLPKDNSIYSYFSVLKRKWIGAKFHYNKQKLFLLVWQPEKRAYKYQFYYHSLSDTNKKVLDKSLYEFYKFTLKTEYGNTLRKVLENVKPLLKKHQIRAEKREIGRILIVRSLYIYPVFIIILIIFLRIKYREKITATSKKKKKKQRKESIKQQKFLLKSRFGFWIFLPFFLFHLFVNFIFVLYWTVTVISGLFILDFLIIYIAWGIGTLGLWEPPSGGGGGYSGGSSYSSSSGYSGGSYSGGSSFGGGSFGGGGASGDW